MICVGIDVAKDKHDCFIMNSDGEIVVDVFTISNNKKGFNTLLKTIQDNTKLGEKVKVGLEATGHYSYNILGFLLNEGLPTYVINPLHTNLYRKSLSLRKTKTDRIDARTIATMLMSDIELKPYTELSYHIEELKSLARYRFEQIMRRGKLKQSVSRLVTILFPELEGMVSTIHITTVYALLSEFPGAKRIASANLTHLKNVISETSRGRWGRDKAVQIRDAARDSIGSSSPSKSMELKHTIKMIQELDEEIAEIEAAIENIMDEINSPITSIPGISTQLGAAIIAEVGNFANFDSPDKILAYAGMSPTIYQSGQLFSSHARMEKRGSKYLRYALFTAAKLICINNEKFGAFLEKKRSEGKHYYVAISHVVKKLIRTIYAMELSGQQYCAAA